MTRLLALFLLLASFPAFAETAHDRVLKSGTLRCGYITWPGLHSKDLATGEMSGMWHDYIMEMAKQLSLKVEWTEEVGPAEFPAALQNGRIDAMCAPIGRLIPRFRTVAFTDPITYIAMQAWVRDDDTRFDDGLASINTPEVTISSMEGEFNSVIAKTRFPMAKLVESPAMLGPAQGYMNVATKKADVVFADSLTIADYVKNNPGQLKPLTEPLGTFGAAIAVAPNETALHTMLNAASRSLVEGGIIAGLIKKYNMQGHILVPAYPSQKVP